MFTPVTFQVCNVKLPLIFVSSISFLQITWWFVPQRSQKDQSHPENVLFAFSPAARPNLRKIVKKKCMDDRYLQKSCICYELPWFLTNVCFSICKQNTRTYRVFSDILSLPRFRDCFVSIQYFYWKSAPAALDTAICTNSQHKQNTGTCMVFSTSSY